MPNYLTELSPDNNTHVYQIKDKEAAPIDLLKDTVGWVGKNLLSKSLDEIKAINTSGTWSGNVYTHNSISYTLVVNSDGYITEVSVSGTASGNAELRLLQNFELEDGKEYILSGCIGGGDSTYKISLNQYYSGASHFSNCTNGDKSFVYNIASKGSNNIAISVLNGTPAMSNVKFYPMLRKADIADGTFEPYHESVEQCKFDRAEQRVLGAKNLLPVNKLRATRTYAGVTLTNNSDGTFSISGTANANANIDITQQLSLANGQYRFSLSESNISGLRVEGNGGVQIVSSFNTEANEVSFDATSTYTYYILQFCVKNGVSYNLTIHPMLRLASDPDDTYVPYAMTNRELTELATTQESAVTNIISGATIGDAGNHLIKVGKVVTLTLRLDGVTVSAWGTDICVIPEGYRPKYNIRALNISDLNLQPLQINNSGSIKSAVNISNSTVYIHTTWITS